MQELTAVGSIQKGVKNVAHKVIPMDIIQEHRGSGGIAPCSLYLSTKIKRMIRFTAQPH